MAGDSLISIGIAAMIQIDREIRDSVKLSLHAPEMGFAATAESSHGDLIVADRSPAAIEVADLNLKRPGVRTRIAQLSLDRHFVAAADQMSFRDLDRLHCEQGEEHVGSEAERGEQDDDRAVAHACDLV